MEDTYRVLRDYAREEIKVKGSRFIAEAIPVAGGEAAEEAIASIRKREHSATHHCTAYRVGPDGEVFRFNDDGEPAGTAGQPILRQIDGRGLTDTLVVVTRYFGGTKLGTGGLIRAYGEAAALALDAAGTQTRLRLVPLTVRFAYPDTSPAMHTIHRFEAEIRDTRYADDTRITLAVRRSREADFRAAFTEALGGRGVIEDPA